MTVTLKRILDSAQLKDTFGAQSSMWGNPSASAGWTTCWPKYTWVFCLEVFILMQGDCFGEQVSRANKQKRLADYIIQVQVLVLKFQGCGQTLRNFVDLGCNSFKKTPTSPQEIHPGFRHPDVSSCQWTVTAFSSIERRVLDFILQ